MRASTMIDMTPAFHTRHNDTRLRSALSGIASRESERTQLRNHSPEEQCIRIPQGPTTLFVVASEILGVRAESNYSRIQLRNGKWYMTSRTLKAWEKLLPQGDFLRCHRSFLLRKSEIAEIRRLGFGIILRNGNRLPLSRRLYKYVIESLRGSALPGQQLTTAKPGPAVHKLIPKTGTARSQF